MIYQNYIFVLVNINKGRCIKIKRKNSELQWCETIGGRKGLRLIDYAEYMCEEGSPDN